MLTSIVDRYTSDDRATLISLQDITYSDYTVHSNAGHQVIITYGPDGVTFAGASTVDRLFATDLQDAKGIATQTTSTKYSDIAMTIKTEETVTVIDPKDIDIKGNPLVQDQKIYVYQGITRVLTTHEIITAKS